MVKILHMHYAPNNNSTETGFRSVVLEIGNPILAATFQNVQHQPICVTAVEVKSKWN